MAAAAAVVALVLMARTWRDDAPPPLVSTVESMPVDAFGDYGESSLAFLSAAASDLTWEEVQAVDLAPRAQVVDSAIARLTAAQRAELVKLIREDLRSME